MRVSFPRHFISTKQSFIELLSETKSCFSELKSRLKVWCHSFLKLKSIRFFIGASNGTKAQGIYAFITF